MPPLICTTWDDGLQSDLLLIEQLDRLGIIASFALSPGRYQNQPVVNDRRGGYGWLITPGDYSWYARHDVLSHGVGHKEFVRLTDAELHQELAESRKWLEDIFTRPVTGLCYPYGQTSTRVQKIVAEHYAEARVTLPRGHFSAAAWDNRYAIIPTAHWAEPDIVSRILAAELPRVLLWGHTYEFSHYPEGMEKMVSIYRQLLEAGARFCSFAEIVDGGTYGS